MNIIQGEVVSGDGWELTNGDSCEWLQTLAPESVDLSIYSPPFASLFTYSASERDIGNCSSMDEFVDHLGFVIRGLFNATKPGRNTCVHITEIASTKQNQGVIGLIDLPGILVRAYQEAGWIYHGRVTIDKDPQAQAIRTKSKALLFVQMKKDSSWSRPALADYILIMRKPGENEVPITHDPSDPLAALSNEDWISWARPIWYGIRESDTLNAAVARENDDERHICPLQLGTIERCVRLWSNPGELIVSPFAGIGSEGYESIRWGRRFAGCELKTSYADTAVRNLQAAEQSRLQGELFESVGV